MATTTNLLDAIRSQNFVAAKQQFAEIIQTKMRDVLAREYRQTADSFLNGPMNEAYTERSISAQSMFPKIKAMFPTAKLRSDKDLDGNTTWLIDVQSNQGDKFSVTQFGQSNADWYCTVESDFEDGADVGQLREKTLPALLARIKKYNPSQESYNADFDAMNETKK